MSRLVTWVPALVWTALPLRPRVVPSGVDPVLAPLALAAAALFVPFVISQAGLQRAMHEREVLALAVDQYSMRLVTHLDVTRAQVEQAVQVICAVLND